MHSAETNAAMDVPAELKGLRLHGMASAWVDLAEQGGSAGLDTSRWLLENLLQAAPATAVCSARTVRTGALRCSSSQALAADIDLARNEPRPWPANGAAARSPSLTRPSDRRERGRL